MKLRDKIESGKFIITTELGPAKGTDVSRIEKITTQLKNHVDAINATDQQGAKMKLGSMVASYIIKQNGAEPVLQLTCRDRNRIALQSDLLSAAVLGIDNVLVLTGDSPRNGDHPEAKAVYDVDSVQLLKIIEQLNEGTDMNGTPLKGTPDIFAGAVVNPCYTDEHAMYVQITRMEKKVAAGARFFQTQPIYDIELFGKFMKNASHINVPVLAGIMPLKSAKMARFFNDNIDGVIVPESVIAQIESTDNPVETGIEITVQLIRKLKPLCSGFHIMPIGWEERIPEILEKAGIQVPNA